MDPQEAAQAIGLLHPRYVVPIHYGDLRIPVLWRWRAARRAARGRRVRGAGPPRCTPGARCWCGLAPGETLGPPPPRVMRARPAAPHRRRVTADRTRRHPMSEYVISVAGPLSGRPAERLSRPAPPAGSGAHHAVRRAARPVRAAGGAHPARPSRRRDHRGPPAATEPPAATAASRAERMSEQPTGAGRTEEIAAAAGSRCRTCERQLADQRPASRTDHTDRRPARRAGRWPAGGARRSSSCC